MKSLTRLLCFALSLLVLTSLTICYGQDVSGMAGEVTDQSGAKVPDAVVTLRNPSTGAKYTQTTNSVGFYRFAEVPPGQGYEATFTAKGFSPVEVKGLYLTVSTTRTQNVTLTVGARAEAVEVTASNSEVTIDTTSAQIGNTFDVVALNNLPVQQRNDPTALFTFQPGVTDNGSVAGARVDQNYVTVDGLDVNDLATGGASQGNSGAGITEGFGSAIVGHAPVDSVEEFHANVAGSQAATGPGSGGQFQLVTKSGTNKFHGNVNEYHRDGALVANSWFSNNATPIIPKNNLIQNQFGGNIGGPIKRDKAFFFFNFSDSRIISSELVQRTVPLDSLRNGNINYCTNASTDCSTQNTLSPAQVQALDPAGIGEDANWVGYFSKRFPHSNNSVTGDGVNSGGFSFNAPNNDYATNYVAKIDYTINDKMKLYGRFTISRENAVETPNEFAGDPATNPLVDRSYAFVIGHNWVIGDSMTNRFYLGETVQKLSFPNSYNPLGSTFYTFGDGADQALSSSLYVNPSAQARRIPIPVIGDDFSRTKGSHTWQVGGTFKNILAHETTIADYNTTEIGLGGYILGLCGPTAGSCGAGNPSLRPSDVDPTNATLWDEPFTFMLGRIANVQSDYNYNAQGSVLKQLSGDQRLYRNYQTQLYAQDSWKLTPSLTMSYGVTYQLFSVPYEVHGLESVEPYTFDQYFNARVSQSSLGETGPDAVPLISYYLGGKANNGPPLFNQEYKNFSPHVGFAWNPGFDKKSVFNLSGSVIYDRSVIFSIMHLQDGDSYLFQQTKPTPLGIPNDPYNSVKGDPRLDSSNSISAVTLTPPATPRPPYQPFTTGGIPNGLQNGLAFNETIDPGLRTPYNITYNAGWQRSLPGDMVVKVSYVGRLGRRLLAQADANQVLDFVDTVSGQEFSQAFGAITSAIRQDPDPTHLPTQPWFENVVTPGIGVAQGFANNTQFLGSAIGGLVANGDMGDFIQAISSITPYNVGSAAQFSENSFHNNEGFSSYNGLLLTLSKNTSHGLHYDANYTWSHSIDNISFFANSQGDTGIGGGGLICDVVRPRECRASSDFDVRQYFTMDAAYDLPFGKNKMFLATSSDLANELIGGWSISGVVDSHTGLPWQTSSNAFVASYSNDAPGVLVGNPALAKTQLTKLPGGGVRDFKDSSVAAAQYIGPVGFHIGSRNDLRGPGYFNADMGLAKNFPILSGERMNLKFRADAFNVFNHPNFEIPSENVFNGLDEEDIQRGKGFGQISYTVNPVGNLNNGARVLELSLRLEF
ncbi:MAG TPA: carboxypeptidase-like regulatory domain-containing protein [Terracidiphilus sp.]|jgi:hypothetical protein|nr:carboxypeptidase-like regulatory domain-containing protein [Terracidiphilus sp.]